MASAAEDTQIQRSTITRSDIAQSLQSFATSFAAKLQYGAERFFGNLGGDFVQQFGLHLKEMEDISREVEKENRGFAKRLQDLKKDFSSLQDYYHVIYGSTKGVVDYGGSKVIPKICESIENSLYSEAIEIMEVFLNNLKERLEKVESDIDKIWRYRCVDIADGIKDQIELMRREHTDAEIRLLGKAEEEQKRKVELLKLGSTTFLCIAVAGKMAIRFVPADTDIGKEIIQAAGTVGKEFVSFGATNMFKGLEYVVSSDLSKKVNSCASKLYRCFNTFLEGVTDFQTKIETLITEIDTLRYYVKTLEQKMEYSPTDQKNIAEWENISIYLQQIHDSVMHLKDKVIERKEDKLNEITKAVNALST